MIIEKEVTEKEKFLIGGNWYYRLNGKVIKLLFDQECGESFYYDSLMNKIYVTIK